MEYPLRLQKNGLTGGSTYTFTVAANYLNAIGGGDPSYASALVYMRVPPSSGSFSVTPTNGTALDTVFVMQACSWVSHVVL
jgi:hypothetical protein